MHEPTLFQGGGPLYGERYLPYIDLSNGPSVAIQTDDWPSDQMAILHVFHEGLTLEDVHAKLKSVGLAMVACYQQVYDATWSFTGYGIRPYKERVYIDSQGREFTEKDLER